MMLGFDIWKIIKFGRKEEVRNEKIIRGLMMLLPNQICINCSSMEETQYICTDFWTFVCMTCSEIHREFTHGVKSVSMDKFTSQEVEALQKGGNQLARERYLKAWDPQRERLPSHVDEVREFIKNVYVDEKYVVDAQNAKCHEDETRKEVEQNEKIIRGLMKLPQNRRCINCNNWGTQYVCTNFWTFVCITCSGIHREFTHRVKCVSMATFTSQEVEALQKGGNQRARERYLKAWDPQRQRLPNNSNFDNVREFIKNVYVNEMYTMENSSYRPPRDTQNAEDYENETRQASSYGSYSQSPPYEDNHVSDHAYDYKFAFEGSSPPVSEYSISNGGYPLDSDVLSHSSQKDTPSPFSEMSPSVVLHPSTHNKRDGGRMLYPQSTGSSASVGSVDGNSVSSKSVYSFNYLEVASESKQSAKTSHTKLSSLASLSERSVSENSDGLDLFSSPFSSAQYVDLFQQSPNFSAPTFVSDQPPQILLSSSLNLFAEMPDQQQWSAGSNRKISDVVSKNEGWATFDTPLNTSSMGTENSIPAIIPSSDRSLLRNIDPYSQDASDHQPSREMSTLWHESAQDFEANAEATRAQDGVHSNATERKPSYQFDLPDDPDMQSTNMDWYSWFKKYLQEK